MDGGGDDNGGDDGTNNGHRGGGGGGNEDNNRDGENNNENSDKQFGFVEKKHSPNAIRLFGGGLLSLIFHRGETQLPQTALQLASSAAESPTHRSLVAVLLAYHTQLSKMAKNHFSSASKSMAKSSTWYMAQLETHPLITKCITGGIIGFLGDFGAQCFAHKLDEDSNNNANANGSEGDVTSLADHGSSVSMQYDVRRGLSAMASAMIFTGPILHYSYDFFERLLPVSKMPRGSRTLASSAHVMADALLLDSAFVALNMLVTGVLEGYKLREDIIPQFQADYMGTLKTSWGMSAIIAPYQLVCFRFLPASLRVLGVNFSDVAWDGVVSYKNHRARASATNAAVDSIQ